MKMMTDYTAMALSASTGSRAKRRIRSREDFEFAMTALGILITAFAKDTPDAAWVTKPVL